MQGLCLTLVNLAKMIRFCRMYTTKSLKGNELNYFVRQIETPSSKVLDGIVLHTGSLQDSSSGNENDRFHWLTQPLQGSNSDWRIVVGFHPLVGCLENLEKMDLHDIFLKYGVDAYRSAQSCTNYVQAEDIAHICKKSAMDRGPCITSTNEKRILHSEIVNGFLLHRVSSLEIVSLNICGSYFLDFFSLNILMGLITNGDLLSDLDRESCASNFTATRGREVM